MWIMPPGKLLEVRSLMMGTIDVYYPQSTPVHLGDRVGRELSHKAKVLNYAGAQNVRKRVITETLVEILVQMLMRSTMDM